MSQPVTTLAPHTFIKGELQFDGPAVIAGQVQGTIKAGAPLEIAAEGVLDGDIRGTAVTIHGTVKGNVVASQACRIGATARVAGNLCTANLAIAEGAQFIGHVCVGETDMPEASAATTDAGMAGDMRPSNAAEEAEALQAVEATITRVEKVTTRREEAASAVATTVAIPAAPMMPTIQILSENVQATLHRAPRIIKAR
jgi:cytoskeletal protein CcmA (bactofilin family)